MEAKRTVFPCNTCSITFPTSALQRSHMRQAWHVNNLRRKISELPALSEEAFIAETSPQDPAQHRRKHSDEHAALLRYTAKSRAGSSALDTTRTSRSHAERTPPEDDSEEQDEDEEDEENEDEEQEQEPEPPHPPPTHCLFCPCQSPSTSINITHMTTTHGLFIPDAAHVDLPALLAHLSRTIYTHRECLYCGLRKPSAQSIQTHMRDKGHCMLRLDGGAEVRAFWGAGASGGDHGDDDEEEVRKDGDDSGVVRVSETELRLASGAIVNSRAHSGPRNRGPASQKAKASSEALRAGDGVAAITAADAPEAAAAAADGKTSRSERRVAVRGEMGLVGVSDEQRRALVATEKKMRRREAVAKAKGRHAMEMQPVKTIYYKTENPVYQAG